MKNLNTPLFVATLIFCAAVIIIICFACCYYAVSVGRFIGLDLEPTSLGDWGDSFGTLNSAFSGLALLGLAATVYLQIKSTQRQQRETGKAEFERVFFQIFALIRELRDELRFSPDSSTKRIASTLMAGRPSFTPVKEDEHSEVNGVEAIRKAHLEITKKLIVAKKRGKLTKQTASRYYNVVVNRRYEPEFSPYFRAIYSLLKRISSNQHLSSEEKWDYGRLLRSQMTSQEACLLGLNGLSKHSKDLSDYIIQFRMLKYSQDGIIRDLLQEAYPTETFRGR